MSFLKHLLPGWKTSLGDKTKANAAILSSIEDEMKDAEAEAIGSKVLMSLETSTGEWLEKYGNLFGVLRRDDEIDSTYRGRIKDYIVLERGTIPAIKKAISAFLQIAQADIEIYEPHTDIFFLNRSKLNSSAHMLGEYYTVAVIDIKLAQEFPLELIGLIKEYKPAGVTVHFTRVPVTYSGGSFDTNADLEINGGAADTIFYDKEYNGGVEDFDTDAVRYSGGSIDSVYETEINGGTFTTTEYDIEYNGNKP